MNYQLEKPADIVSANARVTRKVIVAWAAFLIAGLVWPSDWQLGSRAIPQVLFVVPSIEKAASISPIAGLVEGYLSALALMIPLLALVLIYRDPLASRFRYAVGGPTSSRLVKLSFIYLIFVPVLLVLIYLVWNLPIEPRLGISPTRGQMLFHLMMTNRMFLAILGSALAIGISLFIWLLAIALVGPIVRLVSR